MNLRALTWSRSVGHSRRDLCSTLPFVSYLFLSSHINKAQQSHVGKFGCQKAVDHTPTYAHW